MLIFAAAGDVLDVVVGWGGGAVEAYQLCPFSPASSPNHPPT